MATKKSASKKSASKKENKKIVESDFTAEIAEGIILDIYLSKNEDYNDSVKLTFNNCFVVYGKVIETDESYFISLPSYCTGRGRNKKWKNLAYFFDKDILSTIENLLIDFYNDLESEE